MIVVSRMTHGEYAEQQKRRGWQPLFAPIYNHGDLAYEVAKLREWERLTGVKTPLQIEETIKAWEFTR